MQVTDTRALKYMHVRTHTHTHRRDWPPLLRSPGWVGSSRGWTRLGPWIQGPVHHQSFVRKREQGDTPGTGAARPRAPCLSAAHVLSDGRSAPLGLRACVLVPAPSLQAQNQSLGQPEPRPRGWL